MNKRATKQIKSKIPASALKMRMSAETNEMVIKVFERAIAAVQMGIATNTCDLGIICANVLAIAEHIDGESHYFELGMDGDATNEGLKLFIQRDNEEFPWVEVCGHRT